MPELPEVETIRLSLMKTVVGLRIENIIIRDYRLRWPVNENILNATGQTIESISRRAKFLIITLTDSALLVIHLGMTGRLLVTEGELTFAKHDHIVLLLSNGWQLRYNDPRRFGLFDYVAAGRLSEYARFHQLGPEPLSEAFSLDYLSGVARGSQRPIKHFIMDSRVVTGIGNIYANEILFEAKIHPQMPAGDLTMDKLNQLVHAVQKVLRLALEQGGTTLKDFQYQNALGEVGAFQLQLNVYNKQGQSCNRCGATIQKLHMSNRSSYFCPHCQILDEIEKRGELRK